MRTRARACARRYHLRHTRSLFWEGELILPFGNHPLFRWTLGWLMPFKVPLLKATHTEALAEYYDSRHVVQVGARPSRGPHTRAGGGG